MRRWGSFAHRFERLGTAAERTGTPLPTNGPAEHGWCSSMGGVPGGLSQHPVSPGGRGVPSCTMSPFHHTRPCFPRDGTCVGPYNKCLECCGKGLGCCDKRLWLLCPIYRAYFPQDKRPDRLAPCTQPALPSPQVPRMLRCVSIPLLFPKICVPLPAPRAPRPSAHPPAGSASELCSAPLSSPAPPPRPPGGKRPFT